MDINKFVSENTEFLKILFEQLPTNIFYKDTQCRYRFASNSCCQALELGESGSIIGKTDLEAQHDKEVGKAYYEDDLEIIRTGEGSSCVKSIQMDDTTYYFEIEKRPIKDDSGRVVGIVGIVNDITELTVLSQKLERQAQTDTMTGLFNRTYLDKWLAEKKESAVYPVSIISADCNNLKKMNDTYGHEQGDLLICTTATVLRETLPETSLIFRMGGDEFLAICEGMSHEEAETMVEILKEKESDVLVKGCGLSVAYGIFTMHQPNEDFVCAYKNADADMYKSKKADRGNGE